MTMIAKFLEKNTIFLDWIGFRFDNPGYDITNPLANSKGSNQMRYLIQIENKSGIYVTRLSTYKIIRKERILTRS